MTIANAIAFIAGAVEEMRADDAADLVGQLESLKARALTRMITSRLPAPAGEGLLSMSEVALRLGMNRTRVYELVHSGKLPAHRMGEKRMRVAAEDLERYIALAKAGGV